jgi:hypothetical protein
MRKTSEKGDLGFLGKTTKFRKRSRKDEINKKENRK